MLCRITDIDTYYFKKKTFLDRKYKNLSICQNPFSHNCTEVFRGTSNLYDAPYKFMASHLKFF